jgi:hypothetical protein
VIAQLPTRLFAGRVAKVHSTNCLEIDLDLGFGVVLRKRIVLEGIQSKDIHREHRRNAKHSLVLLVGGKNVIVHTDPDRQDGYLVGRVYLNEKVYHDPYGMTIPFGLDSKLLDVSEFFIWLKERGFDITTVKGIFTKRVSDGEAIRT